MNLIFPQSPRLILTLFIELLFCNSTSYANSFDKLDLNPGFVRIANNQLQIGIESGTGSICELVQLPGGFNQVETKQSPLGLWQMTIHDGAKFREISSESLSPPKILPLEHEQKGLRLAWENISIPGKDPLRVEVSIRLGQSSDAISFWELSMSKPRGLSVSQVRFPRIAGLRHRPNEMLAVPQELGTLARDPRQLLLGKDGKGTRLSWGSPWVLSMQCLAFYQQDGPGFYAACDDPQGFRKEFALWGDSNSQLHFEIVHEPEQEGTGFSKLPYAVVLGTFQGDWTAAARIYSQSNMAKTTRQRGRLERNLVPSWLRDTGLWIWNRGRSQQVLDPAIAMRKHVKAPVNVLWHWWHNCPYDAGFPEYLPPREGKAPFQAALANAQRQDVRAILYMNQRLWGTTTHTWNALGAENYAVRQKDGSVALENYNMFMKAPCAPMCIATRFWRDHYAEKAQEVLTGLKAGGIYMDQTGVPARCYEMSHGHIAGVGRYWADGLALLTADIRDRTSTRGPVALGGEFCGEPWIGSLDMMLALSVSGDRLGQGPPWEPIPFFPAVYHQSAILFGNMAGLAHPPYDEKWPSTTTPTNCMTLLDRKFSGQFYLEQGRTFVWGMQPMLANFLPSQRKDRPEEIDYVTRLVHTRQQSLK